ncbi:MAG: hypothetical protein RI990_1787 [Planctomycetota bacterium]
MSSPLQARWEAICARLNVKPKQFAVLLSITVLAIGALGVKSTLGPKKAAARPAAAAARPSAPAAAASRKPAATAAPAGTTPSGTAVAAAVTSVRAMRPLAVDLDTRPDRDPFHPFFLVSEPGTGLAGTSPIRDGAGLPKAPASLRLKAVLGGELAIIGDETVEVGSPVLDSDGQQWTVESINERSVVLASGGRRALLGYAAPGSAGAGRTAAAGAATRTR